MKKLLSLLSAGMLTLTGVGSVVSCSQKGTTIMEDIQEELSQNTEIIKVIEKESLEVFNKFWEEKQKIDISNEVKDEEKESFNKLVDKVKQEVKQGPVEINSENFDQYGMINHFYNEFKNIFDNFNADLAKKYSNYFANENPLVLNPQDVIFTGNFINFEALQQFGGLVKDIKAVTVTYEIKYSIRFKGQYNPVKMNGAMAITDDYEKLKNTSDLVSNYVINELKAEFKRDAIVLDLSKDAFNDISRGTMAQKVSNKIELELIAKFPDLIMFMPKYWSFTEQGMISSSLTSDSQEFSIIKLQGGKEGKLPDEITFDNFVDWYMGKVLPKNDFFNENLLEEKIWYTYNIWNNRIILAGLPLYIHRKNSSLFHTIRILINKDELKKQVELFAREVIAFYKMYEIESYWTKTVFYLPQNLFSYAIKLANSSQDGMYLKNILNFIVESHNKEEKNSLNSHVSNDIISKGGPEPLKISTKIIPEDSIVFTYDGQNSQDKWMKFIAVNIENKNNLRFGLVNVRFNSKGNQIEFKLKR